MYSVLTHPLEILVRMFFLANNVYTNWRESNVCIDEKKNGLVTKQSQKLEAEEKRKEKPSQGEDEDTTKKVEESCDGPGRAGHDTT